MSMDFSPGAIGASLIKQTEIKVNNGNFVSCGASDCTFACDAGSTPELSTVADAVVNGKVELTVSGLPVFQR